MPFEITFARVVRISRSGASHSRRPCLEGPSLSRGHQPTRASAIQLRPYGPTEFHSSHRAKDSRKRRVLSLFGTAALTAMAWALGSAMMPYAISKLFDWQFQVRASEYARPLGETSGKTLTWAFLGYSPAFQVLMGIFEFVPSLMLFFRRTRRLGAVLLFLCS